MLVVGNKLEVKITTTMQLSNGLSQMMAATKRSCIGDCILSPTFQGSMKIQIQAWVIAD